MPDSFVYSNASTYWHGGEVLPAGQTTTMPLGKKGQRFFPSTAVFDNMRWSLFEGNGQEAPHGALLHKATLTDEDQADRYRSCTIITTLDVTDILQPLARSWALSIDEHYSPDPAVTAWLTDETGDRATVHAIAVRQYKEATIAKMPQGSYPEALLHGAEWRAYIAAGAAAWATGDPTTTTFNVARQIYAIVGAKCVIDAGDIHIRGITGSRAAVDYSAYEAAVEAAIEADTPGYTTI